MDVICDFVSASLLHTVHFMHNLENAECVLRQSNIEPPDLTISWPDYLYNFFIRTSAVK